ncbi:unnamed protein product [Ranitomeya imitator]|uniref:Uncharacterized protein n=1 Tax=Ranitomeya imitator TaxID=111125 RepID=A0ABN9MFP4_9NEOB|nr:unnamed protein product [Ranitomeya imitator]
MVKTKELSKDTRNKIVAMHQAGKTESAIANHPFAAGPRPTHSPEATDSAATCTIQNSSQPLHPNERTDPAAAVYQTNQHIMMYRHSTHLRIWDPLSSTLCSPPGPNPFYFQARDLGSSQRRNGAPFYPSQPVYQSAPIIVPTQQPQQPPPPTKREKKTIRIRDPNQGGKDITEEIMSGGGSRNHPPTPPILRPRLHAHPPQQLHNPAPEHSPVVYGTVESPHLTAAREHKAEENPIPEPTLKASPPALLRLKPTDHGSCAVLEAMPDPVPSDSRPEPLQTSGPLPAPVVVAPAVAPAFPGLLEDGDVASLESALLGEAAAVSDDEEDLCKDPRALPAAADPPATALEMNGISYGLLTTDNSVGEEGTDAPELAPPPHRPEHRMHLSKRACVITTVRLAPSPLIAAAQCTTKTSPPAAVLPAAGPEHMEGQEGPRTALVDGATDSADIGLVEDDSELETSVTLLSFSSRRSPVEDVAETPKNESPEAEEAEPAEAEEQSEATGEKGAEEEGKGAEAKQLDLTDGPPEENGDPEPLRNGEDIVSEGEGMEPATPEETYPYKSGPGAADPSPQDTSPDVPSPPASIVPSEGKRQYDRDFLLGFQFMPACVQKPEGLPPISDVVLDKINQPKLAMRTLDPRMLQKGPDFTPAYADFGRLAPGGRGVPLLNVGGVPDVHNQGRGGSPEK